MPDDDIRISKLIARRIMGQLSDAEEDELAQWLARCDDNRKLYARLVSSENMRLYRDRRQTIDTAKHWSAVEKRIRPRRINPMRYIGYAAAAVLMVGVLVWQWRATGSGDAPQTATVDQTINPGTAKATLILADGQRVELNPRANDSLQIAGMKIYDDQMVVAGEDTGGGAVAGGDVGAEVGWNRLLVPRGGEYRLVMGDGTKVHLNSDSRLEFPAAFSGECRQVRLSGEAYFEVSPDHSHPFIVRTGQMDIRVTGTEFNVKAYDGDGRVQATLVSGRVEVAAGEGRTQVRELLPRQQAEFTAAGGELSVRMVDVDDVTAWTQGQYIFRGDPLEEIMKTLSRWYDFEVCYTDDRVRSVVFAGKLNRLQDISSMLEIIESTGKVSVAIDDNRITFGMK